jgi:pimeloyl-ACP methyl ester carboxylesterase
LYVELARRLAQGDLPVLRFDLTGMGDSEQGSDGSTPSERTLRDMDDAMQVLAETAGIEKFILIGLCSGVDSSHATAVRDPRVIAAAFIDGYSFRTVGFYVRRFGADLLHVARWKRFFQRHLGSVQPLQVDDGVPQVFVRDHVTREEFRRDITDMTRRGMRLLFVYSGGVYYRFNSPRQFFEMIGSPPDRTRIEVETMYSADHVFASVAKRDVLIDRLDRWARSVVG